MAKSLQLVGVIAGYKQNPKSTKDGREFLEHVIGVNVKRNNGFEDGNELVLVKLDKRHVDAGLGKLYSDLRGTEVAVPVYVRAFPSRAGAGYEFHLSEDGKPIQMTAERSKASA